MPVIKSKAKAKNLGAYSVKRKGVETQQQDEGPPRKRPRASSPAPGSADGSSESDDAEPTGAFVLEPYGEDASESDGEDDPGVDVHEENDIPHPKDYTDLCSSCTARQLSQYQGQPGSLCPTRTGTSQGREGAG
ncbi:hypothetical protein B0H14DRAFT_3131068 [Mycena olivaceomarginata]|nr:hypothetical protein B0H14DRAFT_3131068 [Mycena olivaceomarginata]